MTSYEIQPIADLLHASALRNVVLLCTIACAVIGCEVRSIDTAAEPTVVVLAAASTKDALRAIAAEAQRISTTPLNVEISSGPSHALAQQILSGAPADIYVSANRRWAEEVESAGLATNSLAWLENELVLIVPCRANKGIERFNDLVSDKVARVAIAGENVPAGIYAQEALTYHKLWKPLETSGKLVRGHDVRSTLAYAERGEVDAAVVYATDARLTDQVRVVARFDPASHSPIVYPLVRIQSNRTSAAADSFFKFLQTNAAKKIAEDFGFVALRGTAREVE